jgi:hypothetical protein
MSGRPGIAADRTARLALERCSGGRPFDPGLWRLERRRGVGRLRARRRNEMLHDPSRRLGAPVANAWMVVRSTMRSN